MNTHPIPYCAMLAQKRIGTKVTEPSASGWWQLRILGRLIGQEMGEPNPGPGSEANSDISWARLLQTTRAARTDSGEFIKSEGPSSTVRSEELASPTMRV
jgi:hypothetical protein